MGQHRKQFQFYMISEKRPDRMSIDELEWCGISAIPAAAAPPGGQQQQQPCRANWPPARPLITTVTLYRIRNLQKLAACHPAAARLQSRGQSRATEIIGRSLFLLYSYSTTSHSRGKKEQLKCPSICPSLHLHWLSSAFLSHANINTKQT